MKARNYGTILILVHGLVALVHQLAHMLLPVPLPPVLYVIAVLFVGVFPLVSLAMIWTRRRRGGFWLLLVGMGGSLLLAGSLHFVILNPDHVSHLREGAWRPVFQWTAALMAVTEFFGCWLAVWALRGSTTEDHGLDSR